MTKKIPAKCEFYGGRKTCGNPPTHRLYIENEYVGSACDEHTKYLTKEYPYPKAEAIKKQ